MTRQSLVGQALLSKTSRSRSDTRHSVRVVWTSYQPDVAIYLDLTIHNTHYTKVPMSQAGFEPTIPASERLQTHALDRAATYRCKQLLGLQIIKPTICINVLF